MIEVVVMLGILTLVSTAVLVSFTGLNESGLINRSAREFALAIRRAQNMSLAVTQVETSAGPQVPPAVGVKLDRSYPSIYFLFADIIFDKKYTADDAKIGQDENFPPGIKINSLIDSAGGTRSVVYIIFTAPEAAVSLTDENGISIGDKITVELASPSRQKRKVTIRTSGQVSIK